MGARIIRHPVQLYMYKVYWDAISFHETLQLKWPIGIRPIYGIYIGLYIGIRPIYGIRPKESISLIVIITV